MALFDHLRELRNRLFKASLSILAVTALVGFVFYDQILQFLDRPYCNLPSPPRAKVSTTNDACAFIFTGPLDAFNFRFKISFIAGIILSSPLWLYQLWAFVGPGLHKKERRVTYIYTGLCAFFFFAGCAVAYLVLGTGLEVLLKIGGPNLVAFLDVNRYLSYVTAVLLIFGVGFEFPLITTLLNRLGILSTDRMRAWRRYIYFAMFVFAAFATPGGDPFTMTALAIPLCLLYEGSITVARLRDRGKRKRGAGGLGVDTDDFDDEATSPLDYSPAPVAPASRIDTDTT